MLKALQADKLGGIMELADKLQAKFDVNSLGSTLAAKKYWES